MLVPSLPFYLGIVRSRVHQSRHNHWNLEDLVVSKLWDPPELAPKNGMNYPRAIGVIEEHIDQAHNAVRSLRNQELKAGDKKNKKRDRRNEVLIFGTMIAAAVGYELMKKA
jgi:hypothetical protein